jgi:hypothetical protein
LDSGYCVSHDPARVVELAEWRKRGGRSKSNRARALKQLPAEPMGAAELHSYLGLVFKRVITGKTEPAIATAAATVARAMIDVAKVASFEDQLSEMRRDLAALTDDRNAS